MRKKQIFAALITSVCLAASGAVPAMADGMKVVTLGADLSQEQKDVMMRYFKVDSSDVQILTITNEDEREHLSAYVPLEQIGTRTVSCAYVKPTQSGGIKVRTANLNWVTCNMIASTLSTSGVSNCEVVAACPFEVSGTGALTGIIMAYETASGETLDETKKELATQELVVTGNLAEQVGQDEATNIINEAKMEIISSNIQDADEIHNIVVNIAEQNNMQLEAEQLDRIVSLLQEIAQQNYDYEQMKETLENVESNLSGDTSFTEEQEPTAEDDGDSSILDLDESILGDDVIAGSTEDPSLQEETMGSSDGEEWSPEENSGGDEWSPEEGSGDGSGEDEWSEEGSDGDEWSEEGDGSGSEDLLNTDDLSDTAKSLVESAKSFCAGEFEEDTSSSQYSVKSEGPAAYVTLDAETGASVTDKVLEAFIAVLRDGGASYVPSDSDDYVTPELNMLRKSMLEVFALDDDLEVTEGIWADYSAEDRMALYDDTMDFFEDLYGENLDNNTESTDGEEAGEEGDSEEGDSYEEVPQE